MENRPPEDNEPEPEIELEAGPASSDAAGPSGPVTIVYFAEDVLAAMKRHALSDTKHEIAGVLVGQAGPDSNVVLVHAAIAAANTRSSAGNVTFTHESWAQINEQLDSRYPDYVIVGWYHSHPNFGVFLSSYDTFIHQNFFSAPWQIAYVVDPIRGDEGCFVWEDGELVRTPNLKMYMDAEFGEPEAEEPTPPRALPVGDPFTAAADIECLTADISRATRTGQRIALGVLAVLVAIAVTLQVYTIGEILRLQKQLKSDTIEITSQIELLKGKLAGQPARGDGTSIAPSEGADAAPERPPSEPYTVREGDTLQSISTAFYGDGERAQTIADFNGLQIDAELKPGDVLHVPSLPDAENTDTARVE